MLLLLTACGGDYDAPISATALFSGASAPRRVHVDLELKDQDGKGVDALAEGEFSVLWDGAELPFRARTWEDLDPSQPVVILVDLSQSVVDGGLEPLKESLHTLVDELPGPIQLRTFAETGTVRRAFSLDKEALHDEIDALEEAEGQPTVLAENVLEALDDWEDDLDPAGAGVRGALLVITDGGDGPTAATVDELLAARGDKAVIAISVGKPSSKLVEVAEHGVFEAEDWSGLGAATTDALDRLRRARESIGFVSFCVEPGGGHTVEVSWRRDRLRSAWDGSFDGDPLSDTSTFGETNDLPELIGTHHARVLDGWLYIGGGDWDGNIFMAKVLEDGRVGTFHEATAMPEGSETRMDAANGALYAINGDLAWSATLNEDGQPGEWEEMASPGYSNVIRHSENLLFSVARDRVYIAGFPVEEWTESEPYPEALDGYVGAAVVNGGLAVVGSWRASASADWETRGYIAPIEADGLGEWTALPAFPSHAGYWITVDGYGDQIVVFPGDDADTQDIFSSDGSSPWVKAGAMTVERRYYSSAASPEGYVYLHGGYAAGDRVADGFYSQIQEDGRLELGCTP